LKITIRKKDIEHVQKLAKMHETSIIKNPEEITQIFAQYLVTKFSNILGIVIIP
jgi:flavoprotein